MSLAFEITNDDIATVLQTMSLPNGENDVAEVSDYLDYYIIEDLALRFDDLSEQTFSAYEEIEAQIQTHLDSL